MSILRRLRAMLRKPTPAVVNVTVRPTTHSVTVVNRYGSANDERIRKDAVMRTRLRRYGAIKE